MVNKVILIVAGGLPLTVGAFLTGPSKLFRFPNKIGLITAGMAVSGVGKALIQSYAMTYVIISGQEAFPSVTEEVERKIPLMLVSSYGIGAFGFPLVISALYKAINFRTTLDILGVILSLNAGAFMMHAGLENWGRKPEEDAREEQEEQPMLQVRD